MPGNGHQFKCILCVAVFCSASIASANVFNMPSGQTSLQFVPVGDLGNAGELSGILSGGPECICGGVSYTYNIGKYEVTAGQYAEFLNAVAKTDTYNLYNSSMSSTSFGSGITRSGIAGSYAYTVATNFVNRPVNYVSWGDSARFANWLHNGQPTGAQGLATTEDGTYLLNGKRTNEALLTMSRKSNWKWAISSENEWYKAAYYKAGSTNAGYWDYPTRSNTAPGQDMADVSGNNANYRTPPDIFPIDSGMSTTLVGEFQNSPGAYGTFDQGGNLWEWNESIRHGLYRGTRGGAYNEHAGALHAAYRNGAVATYENSAVGFRLSEVPEPATALLLLAALPLLRRRRERIAL